MHHNLQRDILQTNNIFMWDIDVWLWLLSGLTRRHKVSQTWMDFCCSEKRVPSFRLPFGLKKIEFELLKQTGLHAVIQVFRLSAHTLWMLQPVAVCVVQVTTLKLLLAVVWHWHGDEWVHVVKALLIRGTQVIKFTKMTGLFVWSACSRTHWGFQWRSRNGNDP